MSTASTHCLNSIGCNTSILPMGYNILPKGYSILPKGYSIITMEYIQYSTTGIQYSTNGIQYSNNGIQYSILRVLLFSHHERMVEFFDTSCVAPVVFLGGRGGGWEYPTTSD